jgi:ribosomal protein S13
MFEIKKLLDVRSKYNNYYLNYFIKCSYGINISMLYGILSFLKYNNCINIKVKDLTDNELSEIINKIINLNLIYNNKLNISGNIENLRKIKNYKYIRHFSNLPVNGQRTHTNRKTKRNYFKFLNKNLNKHIFKI